MEATFCNFRFSGSKIFDLFFCAFTTNIHSQPSIYWWEGHLKRSENSHLPTDRCHSKSCQPCPTLSNRGCHVYFHFNFYLTGGPNGSKFSGKKNPTEGAKKNSKLYSRKKYTPKNNNKYSPYNKCHKNHCTMPQPPLVFLSCHSSAACSPPLACEDSDAPFKRNLSRGASVVGAHLQSPFRSKCTKIVLWFCFCVFDGF